MRESSYRFGPAKADPEQISSEQSRDVTSAPVISKGREIKIDFLSSHYGTTLESLRAAIFDNAILSVHTRGIRARQFSLSQE